MSNRKAFILVADGDIAVVSGRWRAFCRDAFLTDEAARAEAPAFLGRCRAAEAELLGPDPESIAVTVVPLDLEDDLDAPDGEVFLLSAEGRETLFGSRFRTVCRTLYPSLARAEAEMPGFLDRCADPGLGARHSRREDLVGSIGTLVLRPPAAGG